MKNLFTWYVDCATPEEQAESNLEFAYRAMLVLFGISLLYWGATL